MDSKSSQAFPFTTEVTVTPDMPKFRKQNTSFPAQTFVGSAQTHLFHKGGELLSCGAGWAQVLLISPIYSLLPPQHWSVGTGSARG